MWTVIDEKDEVDKAPTGGHVAVQPVILTALAAQENQSHVFQTGQAGQSVQPRLGVVDLGSLATIENQNKILRLLRNFVWHNARTGSKPKTYK